MKHFVFWTHIVKAKEIKSLNFIKEETVFSPFWFSSQYARDKFFGFQGLWSCHVHSLEMPLIIPQLKGDHQAVAFPAASLLCTFSLHCMFCGAPDMETPPREMRWGVTAWTSCLKSSRLSCCRQDAPPRYSSAGGSSSKHPPFGSVLVCLCSKLFPKPRGFFILSEGAFPARLHSYAAF